MAKQRKEKQLKFAGYREWGYIEEKHKQIQNFFLVFTGKRRRK